MSNPSRPHDLTRAYLEHLDVTLAAHGFDGRPDCEDSRRLIAQARDGLTLRERIEALIARWDGFGFARVPLEELRALLVPSEAT